MGSSSFMHRFVPLTDRLKVVMRKVSFRKLSRWALFVVLVTFVSWVLGLTVGTIPENFHEGAIAPFDIRADREYHLLDEEQTNAAREEAVKSVLSVYDFYTGLGTNTADKLRHVFEEVRKEFSPPLDPEESALLRAKWEEAMGLQLADAQWDALAAEEWGAGVQEWFASNILRAMSKPILAEAESFNANRERGVIVRRMLSPDAVVSAQDEVWKGKQLNEVSSLETVRKAVALRPVRERFRVPANIETLVSIAAQMIKPNGGLNVLESEARRNQTLKDVVEVRRVIQAGQLVVRRGEIYDSDDVNILRGIQRQRASRPWSVKLTGNMLFLGLLILLVHVFGKQFIRKYAPRDVDLLSLGFLIALLVGVLKAGSVLTEAIGDTLPLAIPQFAYAYLMPLATGGMLVRFLVNSETATLFSIVIGVVTGLLFPQDTSYTAYGIISSLAGAAAIAHADKRSAIIRAGFLAGVICAVSVVAIQMMRAGVLSEALTINAIAWYVAMAFGGAIVSAVAVLALTPVFETVFGYTTDIKLLELANLNHPLLRELVIRAPGTYHHSHLVGILAEAAAQVVEANPLLARVGAYYHDIGKIKKPMYFTENIKEGESRHEKLTPHMSALIISSHIKEGLELAKVYKLPDKISAMIPQHHGTNRIGYFYDKAKEAADPSLGEVNELDYRYPGPKPQTREAGILSLADQTEGAVRALKEKSPARIEQTVEQIINKNFAEGQLAECELTLKNLNEIAKAFTRILLGIYHQRIEYPRETLKLHEKDVQVLEGRPVVASDLGGASKTPIVPTRH